MASDGGGDGLAAPGQLTCASSWLMSDDTKTTWQEPRPAPQSEYWWGGNLRAVERLRDAGPLARAFQWMGNERAICICFT